MYIYKTTNLINGKIYVGQSSKSIKESQEYYGSGMIFSNALKKYGKENFKKEIIDEAQTKEELNKKEIFWIKKFKSQNLSIGYNLTDGGTGGDTSKFINYQSDNYRKNLSQAMKGENNHMSGTSLNDLPSHVREAFIKSQQKGIPWSKEQRNKLKDSQKGVKNSQYDTVWCVKNDATNKKHRKKFKKDQIPNGWITCAEFDDRKKDKSRHHYGKKWYNNGTKNFLKHPSDATGLQIGRLKK